MGGERSPFPGWLFQRGHAAFENLGAGRHQRWGCPPSPCPGVPTVSRGVGTLGAGITTLPLNHVCPQTTPVLVPGWVPGGEAAREVPQACPSVGGDPSLLALLPQQFMTAALPIPLLLLNKPEQAQKGLKPRQSQTAFQPPRASQEQWSRQQARGSQSRWPPSLLGPWLGTAAGNHGSNFCVGTVARGTAAVGAKAPAAGSNSGFWSPGCLPGWSKGWRR